MQYTKPVKSEPCYHGYPESECGLCFFKAMDDMNNATGLGEIIDLSAFTASIPQQPEAQGTA